MPKKPVKINLKNIGKVKIKRGNPNQKERTELVKKAFGMKKRY